jgi:hypothetical protein
MMGPGMERTHPLAIASLVTGILAIVPGCCCGFLGIPLAIAAVITGILGMNKINADPNQFKGKGLAIAGLVCGGLGLVVDVIGIVMNVGSQVMQQSGAGGGP